MGVHGLIDAVCRFMKQTSNYSITLCPTRVSVLAWTEKRNAENWVSVYERHCHEVCWKTCFPCMDSPRLFSLRNRLAAFKWKQMKICCTHFLSFLCLYMSPLHPRCARTCTSTSVHILSHTLKKKKRATLYLSVLLSLGTIKSLPQILLRVDEQGDCVWSVMSTGRQLYHHSWLCAFVCVQLCVPFLCMLGMLHSL